MKSTRHLNLNKAISSAFQKVASDFADKNAEIISEPRQWGDGFGTTHRKNGEVVSGGNRNIVDLANLKDSQKLTYPDALKASLEWDGGGETPVSSVYFGYSTKSGRIPGRPWVEVAKSEFDFADAFSSAFKNELN